MDTIPPAADAPSSSLAKKRKTARWSGIAAGLVGIVALIRVGSALFAQPELETCDSDTIRTTIASLVDEQLTKNKVPTKFAKLSAIKTLKSDDTRNSCSARLDFADGTGGQIFYNVTTKEVTIDRVTS